LTKELISHYVTKLFLMYKGISAGVIKSVKPPAYRSAFIIFSKLDSLIEYIILESVLPVKSQFGTAVSVAVAVLGSLI
jgi:hypothetical protein